MNIEKKVFFFSLFYFIYLSYLYFYEFFYTCQVIFSSVSRSQRQMLGKHGKF